MTSWVRFESAEGAGFGVLEGESVRVCEGDLFTDARQTAKLLPLDGVRLKMPVQPGKVIAVWNNFHALIEKMSLKVPAEPLYFIKSPNAYLDPDETIRRPLCDSRIIFEGELAVVIGKVCRGASDADALDHVFGYTCANDVTAVDVLTRNPDFAQWCRAKGFDTFCPIGPTVATGLDPSALTITTVLNGSERQRYPASDMVFSVAQLVSRISRDMTLYPGDMILCGTSVGVGVMKPGSVVEVAIEGIGRLRNRFE